MAVEDAAQPDPENGIDNGMKPAEGVADAGAPRAVPPVPEGWLNTLPYFLARYLTNA